VKLIGWAGWVDGCVAGPAAMSESSARMIRDRIISRGMGFQPTLTGELPQSLIPFQFDNFPSNFEFAKDQT
jgi:hypothetical protein